MVVMLKKVRHNKGLIGITTQDEKIKIKQPEARCLLYKIDAGYKINKPLHEAALQKIYDFPDRICVQLGERKNFFDQGFAVLPYIVYKKR